MMDMDGMMGEEAGLESGEGEKRREGLDGRFICYNSQCLQTKRKELHTVDLRRHILHGKGRCVKREEGTIALSGSLAIPTTSVVSRTGPFSFSAAPASMSQRSLIPSCALA